MCDRKLSQQNWRRLFQNSNFGSDVSVCCLAPSGIKVTTRLIERFIDHCCWLVLLWSVRFLILHKQTPLGIIKRILLEYSGAGPPKLNDKIFCQLNDRTHDLYTEWLGLCSPICRQNTLLKLKKQDGLFLVEWQSTVCRRSWGRFPRVNLDQLENERPTDRHLECNNSNYCHRMIYDRSDGAFSCSRLMSSGNLRKYQIFLQLDTRTGGDWSGVELHFCGVAW